MIAHIAAQHKGRVACGVSFLIKIDIYQLVDLKINFVRL
ncbi:hypothetical protein [Azospirillum melinis]